MIEGHKLDLLDYNRDRSIAKVNPFRRIRYCCWETCPVKPWVAMTILDRGVFIPHIGLREYVGDLVNSTAGFTWVEKYLVLDAPNLGT